MEAVCSIDVLKSDEETSFLFTRGLSSSPQNSHQPPSPECKEHGRGVRLLCYAVPLLGHLEDGQRVMYKNTVFAKPNPLSHVICNM